MNSKESLSSVVDRARTLAMRAHEGQTRTNKSEAPYHTHLEEVAALVRESGGSEEEVAAAWLHDAVEDTNLTTLEIEREFGANIAAIVRELTDPPESKKLPTLARKRLQAEHVRHQSNGVKRVKMADQISNVRMLAFDPPVKWSREKCLDYARGAMEIVEACQSVDSFLYEKFREAYQEVLAVYSKKSEFINKKF